MLTALLLTACSNIDSRRFYPEGGTRHVQGQLYPPETDTGDSGGNDTDTDTDVSGADAPYITDSEASVAPDDDGAIILVVHYDDPQDDVVGGSVSFNVTLENATASRSYSVVSDADFQDAGTEAADSGGTITLRFDAVGSGDHVIDYIMVTDSAGHDSNLDSREVAVP